jgi:glycosyltransferase involved in cell wall biosynthesis
MVVIEAMAARKPNIASNSDGIMDIIEHNHNGVLIPPRDVKALISACQLLAGDRGMRERLAQAAHRSALERFTSDRMLDEIEAIYERMQAR